ncbi:MAG TPA: exonuclease SbcCD subunit D [Chloroflexia bacterium]|nr:exonuclease SbcCD subunit D [Chloroflexia bacterium]
MRLLHVSDIHFGIESYSRIDPVTGLPTRLQDFVNAFDRAIDHGIEAGVDAVLFTGDAYKNRDPNPTVQREFAKRIMRLVEQKIPVFLLTGNHDLPNMSTRAHSIEIFETLAVPGVYVARGIELFKIPTKSGMLQVVSLPWLTRQNLITREEYRGRSLEELNQLMLQKMETLLHDQILKLDTRYPAVLGVHASIVGATYGSERTIMLGQDLALQKSLLGAENFDYIAVGHIHKHQDLQAGDTPIVYPGSLERIDFGEEREDKGYVLVEIDDPGGGRITRQTEWHFIKDPLVRPFRTLDLNIEDLEDDGLLNPTAATIQAMQREVARLKNGGLSNAIVRVRLKLRPEQQSGLREEDLRRALNEFGVYHIAGIGREIERPRRIRLAGESVEGLNPIQVLEKYLETKSVRTDRRELLLKYAHALVHGAPVEALPEMPETVQDSLIPLE